MSDTLSVVLLNWNTRELLANALAALLPEAQPASGHQVIVVDNGSSDGSPDWVAEQYPAVDLIANPENRLYTLAINQGLAAAGGEHILLLNSDVEIGPQDLLDLQNVLSEHAEIEAVAPAQVNRAGQVQSVCMNFPTLPVPFFDQTLLGRLFPESKVLRHYYLREFSHREPGYVVQPPGACLLIRRQAYERLGPLDETMPLYFSDVDYCQRMAQAGMKLYYTPAVQVFHAIGASTRQLPGVIERYHRDRITYYRKYFGRPGAWVCKLAVLDLGLHETLKAYRNVGFGPDLRVFVRSLLAGMKRIWFETSR